MIRPARRSDRSALSALQSRLDAPSPALLAAATGGAADPAVGDVCRCLVSVAGDDVADSGSDGDSPRERRCPTDRAVGYALWVASEDAHLAELVIHPGYRREGRARALLRALFGRREGGTRVTLFVAADNDSARSLYESVGFRPVSRHPDFYDAGDGADRPGAADRPDAAAPAGETAVPTEETPTSSTDAIAYAYEVDYGNRGLE
ncbi:GNAT family N-acetyltransferase [Halobellus sp. GM3]|uniref:GNAT family N-acetyltransferase n=1 Tax=Halobellus sp. GM3 TaxID=3458410 RepID=UPI00403D9154